MYKNESAVRALYGLSGLGLLLIIIDLLVVNLPVFLMALGMFAWYSAVS